MIRSVDGALTSLRGSQGDWKEKYPDMLAKVKEIYAQHPDTGVAAAALVAKKAQKKQTKGTDEESVKERTLRFAEQVLEEAKIELAYGGGKVPVLDY
jgi:hypothetical protein